MKDKKRPKKRYKWSFYKMHPVLQVLGFSLVTMASLGWIMAGMWFLALILRGWEMEGLYELVIFTLSNKDIRRLYKVAEEKNISYIKLVRDIVLDYLDKEKA